MHPEKSGNTKIWSLEFQAMDILKCHQRSWEILDYEPIFDAVVSIVMKSVSLAKEIAKLRREDLHMQ